jgi:tRNA-intron endonuclease, archaea type
MQDKVYKTELVEEKVIMWDKEGAKRIYETGWYGEFLDESRLEMALIEAALLLERGKIDVVKGKKKLTFEEFYKHCLEVDKRFHIRYVVYKDLRERGLPVRTGFKFGCDFRVYERGITPVKKGPKAPHEHTRWVVFCIPEDYNCSFQELSRAVRLSHNIRANMLWAVVDNENDCTYYQITYVSP